MTRRAFVLALSFALGSPLLLTACGGGSGGVTQDPTAGGGSGGSGSPIPNPPPPPSLDAVLRLLASKADAAPTAPPPPANPALVTLGQALFFDRILSGNRNISCYTCHDVDVATTDALSVSIGTGGRGGNVDRRLESGSLIARNAPSVLRLSRRTSLFWDSRVSKRPDGTLDTPEDGLNGATPAHPELATVLDTALAAQAMFPPTNREEMRGQPGENEIADAKDDFEVWSLLMRRLVGTEDGTAPGIPVYRDLFAHAYPGVRIAELNFAHAAKAIAAFEVAAFETRGSPWDAWLMGNGGAMSDAQKRGGVLFFGRADCARCHGGPMLTDDRHHAVGVPQVGPGKDFAFEDTGRALITGDPADAYRFRTPTLRNVALTAPYMHDGAYTSLEAAVRHFIDPVGSLLSYDATQLSPLLQPLVDRDSARQAARIAAIPPHVRDGVSLSDAEVADLLAFLDSLTDAGARDLSAAEPATVPSGIPIDDPND